jgi:transcription initiation factor IIE alpha subunit
MARDYTDIKQRLKSLRRKVTALEYDLDSTMYQDSTEYFDSGCLDRSIRAFPSTFFASDCDDKTVIMKSIDARNKLRSEIEKVEREIQQLKEKSSNNKIKSFMNSLKNKIIIS